MQWRDQVYGVRDVVKYMGLGVYNGVIKYMVLGAWSSIWCYGRGQVYGVRVVVKYMVLYIFCLCFYDFPLECVTVPSVWCVLILIQMIHIYVCPNIILNNIKTTSITFTE